MIMAKKGLQEPLAGMLWLTEKNRKLTLLTFLPMRTLLFSHVTTLYQKHKMLLSQVFPSFFPMIVCNLEL